MKIRAIIFDLDDTLFDCSGQLVKRARRRAASAMVRMGLPLSEKEAYQLQEELARDPRTRLNIFQIIADRFGLGDDFVRSAQRAYNQGEIIAIEPFPDVKSTLTSLRRRGYKTFLVTAGFYERQQKKISALGLEPYFDRILICDNDLGLGKREYYQTLLAQAELRAGEVISVGDRPYSEIRICNELGMMTVQMLHGPYAGWEPKTALEVPDYRIRKISELEDVLLRCQRHNKPEHGRVVAIGGGTGLPIVLEGLKNAGVYLTAIVTVTDAGRSSGLLRRELHIPPPGDIRNCLVALSNSEELLHKLFQYRFDDGSLRGMNFGNLFLSALSKVTGSFESAIKEAARILAVEGKVLPSTLDDVSLCAKLADGTIVKTEPQVRAPGKPRIEEVFLEPSRPPACEEAVVEIERADLIVIGPGSLYTSVISNLLVDGVRSAIRNSRAKKVYVCNIVTQPGQTDGYTCSDHISEVLRYLGEGVLDAAIVNSGTPDEPILQRYKAQGAELVRTDDKLGEFDLKIILDSLIEPQSDRVPWEKADLARHDTNRLASLLEEFL